MYFAEFYTRGVRTENLIPACGDRSVYILDGRNSRGTQIQDALQWGRQHGFEAFKICKGDSFTRAHPVSAMFRTASQ